MGKVYLMGAGPGAADLLTVRASNILAQADAVFHDALVPAEILALATRARLEAVGKRCGARSTAQHFINKRLVDAAGRYAITVRLKGGDPMLFGRAHEEIEALRRAGVEVEVVPGVTAALAAAAQIQVSLTRRTLSRSVVFATPRAGVGATPSNWLAAASAADTAALYMARAEAQGIARELIAAGKAGNLPVAVVEGASLPGSTEFLTTLAELARSGLPDVSDGPDELPTLILVGEVYRELLVERLDEQDRVTGRATPREQGSA